MKNLNFRTLLAFLILITCLLKFIGCVNMGQSIDPHTRTWFDNHRWSHRFLVLTGTSKTINEQLVLFDGLDDELIDRNLIIYDANKNEIVGDADGIPNARGTQRRFGLPENGYEMALVGKDGGVKRRYQEVVNPQIVFDCIDAMPMRIAEMKGKDKSPSEDRMDRPPNAKTIFDFSDLNDSSAWFILLDGVMGGRSTGNLSKTEHSIIFTGETSLKNNGGFSSMQSSIHPSAMEGMNAFKVKLKGDGREWILASRKFATPTADDYWFKFKTSGDWEEVIVPVNKMKRKVYGISMIGNITPDKIKGLSFYIYDKNAGPFNLEIESIKALSQ